MNARQKAKKYKRELDILKGQITKPIAISQEQVETKVVRVKQVYNTDETRIVIPTDVMQRNLLRMLGNSDELREAVKFDYGYFDRSNGRRVCTAELEVVVGYPNYRFDPAYIVDDAGNLKMTEISLVAAHDDINRNRASLKHMFRELDLDDLDLDDLPPMGGFHS